MMNGDKMDEQGLDKVTEKIIGCAYQVSNVLGIGFVEKVYENAHVHQIRKKGLKVHRQYPIKVVYDGVSVGEFFADIFVNELVIEELKAVSSLNNEHIAQGLNYLKASGLQICLLINFGRSKIQVRRLHPSPNWKTTLP